MDSLPGGFGRRTVVHGSWLARAESSASLTRAPGLEGRWVEMDGSPDRAPGSVSTVLESPSSRPARHCHCGGHSSWHLSFHLELDLFTN